MCTCIYMCVCVCVCLRVSVYVFLGLCQIVCCLWVSVCAGCSANTCFPFSHADGLRNRSCDPLLFTTCISSSSDRWTHTHSLIKASRAHASWKPGLWSETVITHSRAQPAPTSANTELSVLSQASMSPICNHVHTRHSRRPRVAPGLTKHHKDRIVLWSGCWQHL